MVFRKSETDREMYIMVLGLCNDPVRKMAASTIEFPNKDTGIIRLSRIAIEKRVPLIGGVSGGLITMWVVRDSVVGGMEESLSQPSVKLSHSHVTSQVTSQFSVVISQSSVVDILVQQLQLS